MDCQLFLKNGQSIIPKNQVLTSAEWILCGLRLHRILIHSVWTLARTLSITYPDPVLVSISVYTGHTLQCTLGIHCSGSSVAPVEFSRNETQNHQRGCTVGHSKCIPDIHERGIPLSSISVHTLLYKRSMGPSVLC